MSEPNTIGNFIDPISLDDPYLWQVREIVIENARDTLTFYKIKDRTVTLYQGEHTDANGLKENRVGWIPGVAIPPGFKKLTVEVLEIKPFGKGFNWDDFK